MERTQAAAPPLGSAAARGARWNGAAGVATMLSQLIQLVLLARWLLPGDFGLAATATAVTAFVAGFSDLGTTHALVQKRTVSARAWNAAWWSSGLWGAGLAGLVVAGAGAASGLLRLDGLAPLLAAAAISLPFHGTAGIFQARLQRDLRLPRLAAAEMAAAAVSLAVAVGWAAWRREAMALVAGQVALAAARCLFIGLASGFFPRPRFRVSDLRPVAAFGAWQMGERALNSAAANLDRLLLAALLGPAAAGYYAVAAQIALRPAALLGPFVARTVLPLLARLQAEPARMGAGYLRSLSLVAFVAAPAYALIAGLAEPLVRVLLGPGWDESVPALRLLAVLGFLVALGNPVGGLMLALGRAGSSFWINAAVLGARLLAVPAGARFGVTGVAAGMLVVTVLTLPLDVLLPRRWLGVPAAATTAAMGWTLLPGGLAAAGAAAIVSWLDAPAGAELVAGGLAAGAIFAVAGWSLARARWRAAVRETLDLLRIRRAPPA